MSETPQTQPPGWYYAQGDPPGTQRYWDGQKWEGSPQPVPGAPQDIAGGPALAEPINRIGARIIDGIVWMIISVVLQLPFAGAAALGGGGDVSFVANLIGGLLATAGVAAYEIGFLGTQGATPGKMALSLKVAREDGSPIDMRDAVMRMAPYIGLSVLLALFGAVLVLNLLLSLGFLGIAIASLVFLFADPRRQTVWDRVGKTIVVSG